MGDARVSSIAFRKRLSGKTKQEKERLIAEEAKLAQEEDEYLADLCGLWDGYLKYKNKEANQTVRKRKLVTKKSASALMRSYMQTIIQTLDTTFQDAQKMLETELPDNKALRDEVTQLEAEVAIARDNLQSLRNSNNETTVLAREFEVHQQNLENNTRQCLLDLRKHKLTTTLKQSEEILDICKWESFKDRVSKVDKQSQFVPQKLPEFPDDPVRRVWIELETRRLAKAQKELNKKKRYASELERKITSDAKSRDHELTQMNATLTDLMVELRARREAETELAQLQADAASLQITLANVCDDLADATASHRSYHNYLDQLSETESRILDLQNCCCEIQTQIETKQASIASRSARNAAMRQKIQTCHQKLAEYQRKLALKDKKIELIQKQIIQVLNGTFTKKRKIRVQAPNAKSTKAKPRAALAPRNDDNVISNRVGRTA